MKLPAGVKRTTGGTFNPEDSFKFFVASNPKMVEDSGMDTVLVAVNELRGQSEIDSLERMLDEGRKVFIDSGIFNLAMDHVRTHGTTHDYALNLPPEEIDGFDRLWDDYADIAARYGSRVWGMVELDQGGAEHKPRTRARIEKELGIVPMPVYHPLGDGWDYYDTLAREYDRICFGNIVQASPPARLRLVHTAYERARSYPYLWTHLLGLYPNQNLLALRMRGSSDASAWLTPARWMPSWRGWSSLRMVTNYPPSMWQHAGTNADYDRGKLERLCGNVSQAAQMTLDDVLADTHPRV